MLLLLLMESNCLIASLKKTKSSTEAEVWPWHHQKISRASPKDTNTITSPNDDDDDDDDDDMASGCHLLVWGRSHIT